MTTTSQPQPLPTAPAEATDGPGAAAGASGGSMSTWLILAAAVAFVAIAQFSLGGSSEARDCKREAQENAGIAQAVGGVDRYVEGCLELQKKVREVAQRR